MMFRSAVIAVAFLALLADAQHKAPTFTELAARYGVAIPTAASRSRVPPPKKNSIDDLFSDSVKRHEAAVQKEVHSARPAPAQAHSAVENKFPAGSIFNRQPASLGPQNQYGHVTSAQHASAQPSHPRPTETHAASKQALSHSAVENKFPAGSIFNRQPASLGQHNQQGHPASPHQSHPRATEGHGYAAVQPSHPQPPRGQQEHKQQPSRPECGYSCAAVYDPVCGIAADGTTKLFPSACDYGREANCNQGSFVRMEKGTCDLVGDSTKTREQKVQECIQKISCTNEREQPLCAYKNDKTKETFANTCVFIGTRKCMPDVYQGGFEMGYCGQDPATVCRSYHCPTAREPVCGVNPDGTTKEFDNECSYNGWSKCNPGQFPKLVKGACHAPKTGDAVADEERHKKEVSACASKVGCPFINSPTCGQKVDGSFELFGNDCEYEANANCDPEGFTTLSQHGECPKQKMELNGMKLPSRVDVRNCIAQTSCHSGNEPMCAVKANGSKKTFSSHCEFMIHKRCDPQNYPNEPTAGACVNPTSGLHGVHGGAHPQQHPGQHHTTQQQHRQTAMNGHPGQQQHPQTAVHGQHIQQPHPQTAVHGQHIQQSHPQTAVQGHPAQQQHPQTAVHGQHIQQSHAQTAVHGQPRPQSAIQGHPAQQPQQHSNVQQHGVHPQGPQSMAERQAATRARFLQVVEQCKAEHGCPTLHGGMCVGKTDGTEEWFSNSCVYNHAKNNCGGSEYTGVTRPANGITECRQEASHVAPKREQGMSYSAVMPSNDESFNY